MSDLTLNILIRASGKAATASINKVAIDAALAQDKLERSNIATAISQERLSKATAATALAQERLRGASAQAALKEQKLATANAEATASMDEQKVAGEGMTSGIMGGLMGVVMTAAMVVPVLVGIGKKAVEMDGAFQTASLSLVAHAGLVKSQMDNVSSSVLQMASQVGRSPVQLEEALYPILSAFSGIQNQSAKTSLALATLKMSFQAVAGTTVDGTAVAQAAVGTFNSLGLATNNAATNTKRMTALMDVMDLTVQLGNMNWNAYKNVIAKLAISIQGTSIKFNEASSALAVLTNGGMSAQKAQTYLSNMFTTMAIKTDALAKHAKKLGLSFDEQKYSAMNLADKIAYLNEVTGGNKQKILALLGGNATALKSFNSLSTGLQAYKDNLNKLNNAQGALKASFDTAAQGMQFAWSRVKAGIDAIMIAIGSKLLPIVTFFITKAVMPLVTWLSNLVTGAGGVSNIFGTLGINTTTLSQIWSLFGVSIAYIKDIFMVVVQAIQGPVSGSLKGMNTGLGSLINGGLLWFRDTLAQVNGVLFNLTSTAGPMVTTFISNMKGPFKEISGIIGGVFASRIKMVSGLVKELSQWFQSKMLPAIKQAMPGFISLGNTIMTTVVPGLLKLWAIGQGFVDKVMPQLIHVFEAAAPPMMRIYGIIAGGLSMAIKFLTPYILQAAQAVVKFAEDILSRVLPSVIKFWNAISAGLDWLQANWKYIWPSLSLILKGTWDIIVGIIKVAWALVSGIIKIGLDIMSGNWKQAWNDLKDMLAGIWDGIKQIIQGQIENIKGIFSGLATLAISWGQNLINGFVQGIKNKIGDVGNAIGNVAQTVKDFIGHLSPTKKGPGRTSNLWGPNLVKMFAEGISSNSGKAQQAAEGMMSGVLKAVQKYQILVLQAEHDGNKKLATEYRTQEGYLKQQESLYAAIARQHGDKINLNNLNNPIIFRSTTGVLNGPGGTSTASSGSTGTGGGSTPTYQIINNNTVEIKPTITLPLGTSKQDIQRIAHELDIEWGKMYRRKGINIPNSSGVAS